MEIKSGNNLLACFLGFWRFLKLIPYVLLSRMGPVDSYPLLDWGICSWHLGSHSCCNLSSSQTPLTLRWVENHQLEDWPRSRRTCSPDATFEAQCPRVTGPSGLTRAYRLGCYMLRMGTTGSLGVPLRKWVMILSLLHLANPQLFFPHWLLLPSFCKHLISIMQRSGAGLVWS